MPNLQPDRAEQGLSRPVAGPSAFSADPPFLADAVEEEERRLPHPFALGGVLQLRRSVLPTGQKHPRRKQRNSHIVVRLGLITQLLRGIHTRRSSMTRRKQTMQSRSVAGPPARIGAHPNVPESMTSNNARILFKDNKMVIGCEASLSKILIFN